MFFLAGRHSHKKKSSFWQAEIQKEHVSTLKKEICSFGQADILKQKKGFYIVASYCTYTYTRALSFM
jgi:hypothetical protein